MMAIVVASGCAPSGTAPQSGSPDSTSSNLPEDSAFVITATIKELMDSTVDPAADGLWEAVTVSSTADGIQRRQPQTDEEWKAVRRHAVTLIEAMNLVVMRGRQAAPEGTTPGLGELAPKEIGQRIEQTRPVFVAFADALRGTGLKALGAIDRKDPEALIWLGGEIDEACEACHVAYWYVSEPVPSR